MRRKIHSKDVIKKVENWTGALKGVPCFLIGNGPSLKSVDLSVLDDKYFSIGINRAFLKIDPTILIWQDMALWVKEKKHVKKLKALKYCRTAAGHEKYYQFRLEGVDPRIPATPSILYGRGSSGRIAYQLAHVLGCEPIILVGMDCKKDKKGRTNFYGTNPMHRGHTLPNCRKGLKWIQKISHKNRKVINCSKNDVFSHRLTLEEAINSLKSDKVYSRDKLVKKITQHKI